MSKTPKNLKKALSPESKKLATKLRIEDNSKFPLEKLLEESEWEFREFAGELAQIHIGWSHSSGLLDDATESQVREFLNGPKPVKQDWDSSDDDDGSSETFDKYDKYDDIKDLFKTKFDEAMSEVSYLELESFKKIYKIAKKKKFIGDELTFQKYIRSSDIFRNWARENRVAYTG